MSRGQYAQWIAAGVLFLTWTALVWYKVPGAGDLVLCIKTGLGAFGLYCWHDQTLGKVTTASVVAAPEVAVKAVAVSEAVRSAAPSKDQRTVSQ